MFFSKSNLDDFKFSTGRQCGVVNRGIENIIGGQDARKNRYPWQVRISFNIENILPLLNTFLIPLLKQPMASFY